MKKYFLILAILFVSAGLAHADQSCTTVNGHTSCIDSTAPTGNGGNCINGRTDSGAACFTGPAISSPMVSCNADGSGPTGCIPLGPSAAPVSANDYVSQGFSALGTTNTAPAATTGAVPATNSTCPNGGQLVNGVCNLGYTPLEPIPGVTDTNLTSPQGFASLVNAIFKIMITAGALLAVLMLTIGGVQYMTSSSIGNKTQGLDRAKAAIYGLLLLAAIYLILNTINPRLLNFDFIACSGGGCQSSINSFTQTTGFTTPSATPTQDVSLTSDQINQLKQAGATVIDSSAIQFNNQDSNSTQVKEAVGDKSVQCTRSNQVAIPIAGSSPGQTDVVCGSMLGFSALP